MITVELPRVTCAHLPTSNRMLSTVSSDDEIVYIFWFYDGKLVDARLKVYGYDSDEIIFLNCGRKVGSYAFKKYT